MGGEGKKKRAWEFYWAHIVDRVSEYLVVLATTNRSKKLCWFNLAGGPLILPPTGHSRSNTSDGVAETKNPTDIGTAQPRG